MTSLPAQIEAREPGWYWVRVFDGAPWNPYHWYHSRDGEAFWIGRAVDDEPMAEIGPRIPDPVTLQQHERLEAEYAHLSETAGEDYDRGVQVGLKFAADQIERLEAVVTAARRWRARQRSETAHLLARAVDALDTAAPDKPEDAERER